MDDETTSAEEPTEAPSNDELGEQLAEELAEVREEQWRMTREVWEQAEAHRCRLETSMATSYRELSGEMTRLATSLADLSGQVATLATREASESPTAEPPSDAPAADLESPETAAPSESSPILTVEPQAPKPRHKRSRGLLLAVKRKRKR